MTKSVDLINLTTHNLTDVSSGQEFPPSGIVAKVEYHREQTPIRIKGFRKEIKVSTTVYKDIIGLPDHDEEADKLYVVSAFIINALASKGDKRNDVIAPGPRITGADNETVGCNSFRFNG